MFKLRFLLRLLLLAGCSWAAGQGAAQQASEPSDAQLLPKFRRLLPLHTKLGKPNDGDWLAEHPEPGQTFPQYVNQKPVRARGNRRTIYVEPLGDFTLAQKQIVDLTTQYLTAYFSLPVEKGQGIALGAVPANARRNVNPGGSEQLLTSHILDRLLRPRLPKDAVALIALTASDLWPGEGWNFVFGQASLKHRVGVWSIHRFGDPEKDADELHRCLRRTMRVATHETGHMFSMQHCTRFECNMAGSNHMAEADRHPLWLCPHCLAKLCYATGSEPESHLQRLVEFYGKNGFAAEAAFCGKELEIMRGKGPPATPR